ncbi:MAG: LamG-like jellyroll fold domain-containing protein, partial [Campylobacterales bacterium]
MRVLLLSLVIGISSLFAAVNPGACSPAGSRDVVINQVFNSNGGTRAQDYVELHVNAPSVDLTGWTISIGKNNSIDATISVPLGHKNGTGVALGASAVAGTFIVFNEQAFGFSISNNNGEILLKDGSGNVVHYLAYYQGAAPDYWDHSGLEDCKTILPGYNLNSGSNPGICSKPDGDEPRGGGWITACESSLGYSNTGLMCSDVFGNAVGTIPGGEVWTDGNLYNTDDGLLYTGNLGGNNIATGCDGSSCAEGGSSIPLTMPSNSSTTNASGSTVLPTGTDTYYRTYTNFNSGDTISVNGAGTARMHIRQNGMIINGKINENGHPSRLIMYVKGNVTLNGDAVVNAILYVEGDVTVNGIVKGAITASGKITINGSGKVYYDQGAVDQADFDGACANTGFTGPTLHYTFSDCTVGQPVAALMDVSGNGNHATAYGNPLCVDTGNGGKGVRFNTDAAGNSFQLKNQYGKTNANFSFTYDEGYTVFARLRFNWSPKRIWAMFFGMKGGDSCNNNGAHWLINTRSSGDCGNLGKGVTQFGPFCGPQNRFDLTNYAGKDIALATVYYSSNKKLITYLDGVKVAEDTAATHPVSGNAPVYIAQPWSSCSQDSYFSGIYDELRIYPRALSEGEIMGLFSSPINAADNSPPTSANRRIGTKIAGKAFSLYVAGLNDDRDALQDFTKSDVKARVVEASACPSFDNGLSDWSDPLKLHGAGNPTSVSFLVEKPVKDAKIQFEWDDDGVTKRDCSFDNFSIRPAALAPYSLSAIAGETVRITENSLRAINENGTTVSNYASQLRGAEIIFNHAIAQGCSAQNIPQLVQDINLTYRNGAGDLNATFLEVGEFNLTVADETWTAADQMAECVLFCGSNIPDTNKLVGCNIEGN